MISPQTFSRNCCQFQLKNPWKKAQPRPVPKEVKKVQIDKQKRISLKNYSSLKHLKLQELTKFSTEIPLPLEKFIIEELQSIDDNLKNQLRSFKEHNSFSRFGIEPMPYHQAKIQVQRQPTTLQKSKSMTKVMFSYNSIQIDASDHEQVKHKVNMKSEKGENLRISTSKQELRVSGIEKLQAQEDMRSTIQPMLQGTRRGMNQPRSIISIEDDEEMKDFMNESLIIERHSEKKTIGRLL